MLDTYVHNPVQNKKKLSPEGMPDSATRECGPVPEPDPCAPTVQHFFTQLCFELILRPGLCIDNRHGVTDFHTSEFHESSHFICTRKLYIQTLENKTLVNRNLVNKCNQESCTS